MRSDRRPRYGALINCAAEYDVSSAPTQSAAGAELFCVERQQRQDDAEAEQIDEHGHVDDERAESDAPMPRWGGFITTIYNRLVLPRRRQHA